MKSMLYPRDKLLAVIKANRDKHRDLFLKAQKQYRKEVIEALDDMLAAARAGSKIRTAVGLEAPQDMTEEYDRVIAMLEMTLETQVELSEMDFSQYVQDNWSWSQRVTAVNSSYATKLSH